MQTMPEDRSSSTPDPVPSYKGGKGSRDRIQNVKLTGDQIPRPPPLVSPDDESRNQYVSEALSADEKKRLKNSAENLIEILVLGGQYQMGPFNSASSNLAHYADGGSQTKHLEAGELKKLERDGEGYRESRDTNLFKFIKQIYEDFSSSSSPASGYISLNPQAARNRNWFGASTKRSSEMFYAMGGFSYAFGAVATRKQWNGKIIAEIRSRTYVYDRYNWDLNKAVTVPKDRVDQVDRVKNLGSDGLQPLKDNTFKSSDGQTYPYLGETTDGKGTAEYVVTDAVPGFLRHSVRQVLTISSVKARKSSPVSF